MIVIPRSWATDPQVAVILSALAGVLILGQSLVGLSGPPQLRLDAGALIGLVIVGSALWIRTRSRYRPALGGLILGLSLLSLVVVSGYFFGAILGVIGGALALASRGSPFGIQRPSPVTAQSLGPPCPRCGRHIPTWTSKCPYCGYPD